MSSEIKRNELPSHTETWRTLKCTRPSERSQSEDAVGFQAYDIQEKAKLGRE